MNDLEKELFNQERVITQMMSALGGRVRTFRTGGNLVASNGDFQPSSATDELFINHNLGVIPDIIIVSVGSMVGDLKTQYCLSVSSSFLRTVNPGYPDDITLNPMIMYFTNPAFGGLVNMYPTVLGHDLSEWDGNVVVELCGVTHQVTTTSFAFGGGSLYDLDPEKKYYWFAFGGIA